MNVKKISVLCRGVGAACQGHIRDLEAALVRKRH